MHAKVMAGLVLSCACLGPAIPHEPKPHAKKQNNLPPLIRKDVRDLTDREVKIYREAVRRLQARQAQPEKLPDRAGMEKLERTSYVYQALLHTNYCPHGNWWFLPWHRAYLYYFEQLLRHAVKDDYPDALPTVPYWDWTDQRELPELFQWDPDTNCLADPRRYMTGPLKDEFVGPEVIKETVAEAMPFTLFGSERSQDPDQASGASPFEAGPHGGVHVAVGWTKDGKPGDMARVATAGFDPVFWSHHANVDRLWNIWLAMPGHHNPDLTLAADRPWWTQKFTAFVDAAGKHVDISVENILTSPAFSRVVYQPYSGRKDIVAKKEKKDQLALEGKSRGNKPLLLHLNKGLTVEFDQAKTRDLGFPGDKTMSKPAGTLTVVIQGITPPKENFPLAVRAFLNLPNANADTSIKDPHYIGTFTFFGQEHGRGHKAKMGMNQLLGLEPALKKLQRAELLKADQKVTVTLVLVPLAAGPLPPRAPNTPELELPVRGVRIIRRQ